MRKIAHPARNETDPVWSPDGTMIAFVGKPPDVFDPQDPYRSGVYVMNADGTVVRRLTKAQDLEVLGSPMWSPDGATIAFTARSVGDTSDTRSIYIVRTDGSAVTELVHDATEPVWQPE